MNKGIKFILTCLTLVFFMITGLYAQQDRQSRPQGPPPPHKLPDSDQVLKMVDHLAKILSLTAEQKEQVSKLHVSHFKEARELMGKNREAMENHRLTMENLRKNFEKQLKALFNEEQKREFEKFVKNHERRPGQQKPERR